MSKLKDLIALNILGWKSAKAPAHWACDSKGQDDAAWEKPNGELVCKRCQGIGMEPETDLNDALLCLERAFKEANKDIGQDFNAYGVLYSGVYKKFFATCDVETENETLEYEAEADTAALAICICALRSVGVPEPLITQAMEEK